MSAEIRLTAGASVNKGGAQAQATETASLDMAGNNMLVETITVTTAAMQLTLPNISGVPPALLIKNLDAANFFEVDSVNTFGNFPQKVRAGQMLLLAPQTTSIWLRANSANCQGKVWACEA